jgi:linoleoyl-CoA desaturase
LGEINTLHLCHLRDKHIHIESDSQLLKRIYSEVDKELKFNKSDYLKLLWVKFLFYSILSILFYTTLFYVKNHLLFLICFILYGFSILLFAFNFAHDLSHNTIFKSKRLNNFFYTLIYTIVGAHAEAWKQRHVQSHHYAPNVKDYDTDLNITKLIRVIPRSEHHWFHKYQHIYAPLAYTSYSLFWVFVKDFIVLFSKDEFNKKKNIVYHLSFWLQKTAYITITIILPITFSLQQWYIVILGFLFMHLFQSLFLLFTFFMTHHVESTHYPKTDEKGYITSTWLMNQVKSSNDMHPFSEIANFILGGFNNHIAHHLFPHIHHLYYPKINIILYRILEEQSIVPNRTSYWGGIVSHLKHLKNLSLKPL